MLVLAACQPEPSPPVEVIELSTDSLAIQFRDSASEVTAKTLGHLGTELDAEVVWKSLDETIVKVVQQGKVARLTPVNIGAAQIQATAETKVALAKVVVLDTVHSVTVFPSDTMVSKLTTTTYLATVDPPSASTAVHWEVVNPRVAQLSDAHANPVTVLALDSGTTEIIATSSIDGRRVGTALFRVARPVALAFELQPPQSPRKIYAQNFMSPGPQVIMRDELGHVFTSIAPVTVTLTPGTGTAGATMFGTFTQLGGGSSGARFNDLGIDRAGVSFTLTATALGVTSAISAPFEVLPECDGIPHVLGSQHAGTLSSQSCEPSPGLFYDRLIVSSTTQQYFNLKVVSSFGARHSIVDPQGGVSPIRSDSAYYVLGPGNFDLRVWSSATGATGSYEIEAVPNPSARPACGENASEICSRITHIGRNVNFSDSARTSNSTIPGTGGSGVYSKYRFVVRPNESPTITLGAPSPPAVPLELDALLRVCREGTDECLQDDNGFDGRNAKLTIPAAPHERSFTIFAWLKSPAALRSPFTLIIN
jgi:hypothetical protein